MRFPQDGVLRSPGALDNLKRALDLGVDVVGGIPHFERTMADGAESVKLLCELAAQRGLRVDMHCDETDDPMSRHIETLAYHTQRLGLQGRVNGSHLTSMHSMDNYYVSKLIPLMAEARVSAVANPLINITIQGRHDTYPKRRGMTRVPELLAAGVPGRLRSRLRDGPLVQPRLRRHAGGCAHGSARGADDRTGGNAGLLRCCNAGAGCHSQDWTGTGLRPAVTPTWCYCRHAIRSRLSGCVRPGWLWSAAVVSSRARQR